MPFNPGLSKIIAAGGGAPASTGNTATAVGSIATQIPIVGGVLGAIGSIGAQQAAARRSNKLAMDAREATGRNSLADQAYLLYTAKTGATRYEYDQAGGYGIIDSYLPSDPRAQQIAATTSPRASSNNTALFIAGAAALVFVIFAATHRGSH